MNIDEINAELERIYKFEPNQFYEYEIVMDSLRAFAMHIANLAVKRHIEQRYVEFQQMLDKLFDIDSARANNENV